MVAKTISPEKIYEKKIIQLEQKIRRFQVRKIISANRAFDLSEVNISKLLAISDLLHKKMLELIEKIRATEKKMSAEPDYFIVGKLYCILPLPDDEDFSCDILNFPCSKEHPFNIDENLLEKSFRVFGFPKLGCALSYPFCGLVEEIQMSLPQIIQLSEENLYFGIRIDL